MLVDIHGAFPGQFDCLVRAVERIASKLEEAAPSASSGAGEHISQHSNGAEPAEIAACQCCGKPVHDQTMFCSEVCARTGGQQLRHC